MSTYKKVVTHFVGGQNAEEGRAVTAMKPGHLVTLDMEGTDPNDLKVTLQATSGLNSFVVIEDTFYGKTVRDELAINERVRVMQCLPGMRFTAIVMGTAAVAVNAYLKPHTDGCVIAADANAVAGAADAAASMCPQIFQAMESCALNSTGDSRRILVRVIR